MDLRPDVNARIVLRDPTGVELGSRVEDLGPGRITVARPFDLPAEHEYGPGAELLVTWTTSRGMAVLPTELLEAHNVDGIGMWSLGVTGAGHVEQQRRFVRVRATGPILLQPREDGSTGAPVRGHLVDVSEAALRCTVEATAADALGDDDPGVVASFRLGEGDFAVPSRVGSRTPTDRSTGLTELVVVFDEPVREADALRKQVYRHELLARRARDDGR